MRYIKSFQNDAAIQAAVDNKTLGKPYVALNNATGKIDWNGKDIDYSSMYLTIEALSGGTFYVRKANFGYSVNGADWEPTTGETALSLNQGDEVRFKGNGTCKALFSGNTMAFNAYGNIESLEYGDNFSGATTIKVSSEAFMFLFYDCKEFIDASKIILPATTLKKGCYMGMFRSCANLSSVPKLLAPSVPSDAYNSLFTDCTKLNYIVCLATSRASQFVTSNWLFGVSPTGTFVKKAGVAWPTGNSGIPDGWTVVEE